MDKIEELKKHLEKMLKENTVTPQLLKEFVEFILAFIAKNKKEFETISEENLNIVRQAVKFIEQKKEVLLGDLDGTIKEKRKKIDDDIVEIKKIFSTELAEAKKFLAEVKAIKVKVPKDGKAGSKGERGDDGRDGSPDTAAQMRDKLESLKPGEKLSINAIEELAELLEELSKKISAVGKGGGKVGSYGTKLIRFIDDFTPIGTVNGVNTIFKLVKTPQTGSLKVYRGGARQRVTEDYTFDGFHTITFIVAPQVGEILLCDFRY